MGYRVTLWHNHDPQELKHYLSRSQAIHGMRLLAYAALQASGKLDTIAAHKVMAAIDRCDDIMPPQHSQHVEISNTGYDLTISNTARSAR